MTKAAGHRLARLEKAAKTASNLFTSFVIVSYDDSERHYADMLARGYRLHFDNRGFRAYRKAARGAA